MTGRLQVWVCVLLAVCVLAVLLLPVIPVPGTTMRTKHSVRPAHAAVALVLMAAARQSLAAATTTQQLSARQARLATCGPDLVDLTTIRLC